MNLNKSAKSIPQIIYGTAWKEDATEALVLQALEAGFRAIDTANQRRHYNEAAVGSALSQALKGGIRREELFIQTKFTYASGQDHRIPYDVNSTCATQIMQSFQSSLEHLQITYVDSYVLHGPSVRFGLTDDDWQVWQEMESICTKGLATNLGISNVNLDQLQALYEGAQVKPKFVQNRCFAQQEWDGEVRAFCKQKGLVYQGFSLLTANPFVLPQVQHIADRANKTTAQIVLRFALDIGIIPLTGTTSQTHMKEDLALDFSLTKQEIEFIEKIAVR